MTHSNPRHRTRRRLVTALPGLALPGLGLGTTGRDAQAAAATDWPQRPLTLIVPFAPGGIADLTARAVAPALSSQLGKPVVVDNRPSAGSIVGSQAVARAEPDGHTLLLLSNANAVSASLFRKLPYDVQKDLAPVSTLGFFDLGLFVAPEAPWKSLPELLAHARAHPGKLTLGTIAVGSTQHLAAELFRSSTGIEVVTVPYKGTPALLTALRGGEIDFAFEILGPWLPQLAARAVRALAVTAERRFPDLPEVPTVQEAGVPRYQAASWNALAVPAATPRALVERLQRACAEALRDPGLQRQLRALGVRAQSGTPAELAALLDAEIRRWGEVIRAARIEPQ